MVMGFASLSHDACPYVFLLRLQNPYDDDDDDDVLNYFLRLYLCYNRRVLACYFIAIGCAVTATVFTQMP